MEIFVNMHKCAATVEPVDGIAFSERVFLANSMGHNERNKKSTRTTEMENLSLDISLSRSSFSRDLLQRFMGSGSSSTSKEQVREEEEDDEIELNLGLSLGGRFGVDKSSSKLVRSSSIASCLPVVKDDNDASTVPPPLPVAYTALRRTSSLPVETEEEWRKRKELQTLRRMEAKRRRSEKQKNLRAESGVNRSGSLSLEERKEIEVNLRERLEREKAMSGALRRSNSSQFGPANFPTSHGGGGGGDIEMAKGKGSYVGSSCGMKGYGSQGSIESKGGSSSSDLGSKTHQGSSGEVSPSSIQSLQEGINPRTNKESPSKRTDASKIRARETGSSSKEDMPSVFTRGDGPNGKRVDGILYKYGKGVEVRIMCVCHGTFHSPAEFVRHAGGADVDNPLKHIVINSNSSAML